MKPPIYEGKKIVIEIRASSYWCDTVGEAKKWEREMRDALDARVRDYLRVGPRSKIVTTRLVDA